MSQNPVVLLRLLLLLRCFFVSRLERSHSVLSCEKQRFHKSGIGKALTSSRRFSGDESFLAPSGDGAVDAGAALGVQSGGSSSPRGAPRL